jgi:RHS repeat-associated protein
MVATSRDGRQLVRCGFVVREHNGDWWYVVGPGLDEPLLAVKRGFSGMANATQLWLPVVSDDRGQLIAIADSGGQLQGPLIGPQYDAGLWNSSGLTSHAQSFNPRRWATPGGIDTISTFRSRQYDPATGKWLQEDPIGIAGGVNLYGYNGNDPNSFGDPFGLCPPCTLYVTDAGKNDGASLDDLQAGARRTLQDIADSSGHDLGMNAVQNGSHVDPRHNGVSQGHPSWDDPRLAGLAVDIGEIDHRTVRASPAKSVMDVVRTATGFSNVRDIFGPTGLSKASQPGGPRRTVIDPALQKQHTGHFHISFFDGGE